MNSWQIALKQYNSDRDKYIIPKKGTDAYNAVKNIQDTIDGKSKKNGKGLKDTFVNLMNKTRNVIKSTIEESKYNNPAMPGEIHGINVRKEDDKLKYRDYQYLGPGTKVKQRLELEKTNPKYRPINNIDSAARSHDINYSFDIANDVKNKVDKKIIKNKVRNADDKFLERINKAKHEDPLLVSSINKVFYGKKIAEDTGFLNPAAFASGEGVQQKKSKKGREGQGLQQI